MPYLPMNNLKIIHMYPYVAVKSQFSLVKSPFLLFVTYQNQHFCWLNHHLSSICHL